MLAAALTVALYYGGLNAGELAATEYGLSRGLTEMHPWQQHRGGRLAVKAASTFVLTGADVFFQSQERKGRPGSKTAKWALRVGFGVGCAYITARNLRLANRSSR